MCAHAVRVAMERLDGVESATVSLEDGVAVVMFADGQDVGVSEVRQLVRDNGFSPRETEITAVVILAELDGGGLGAWLAGQLTPVAWAENSAVPAEQRTLRAGQRVRLEGRVPAPDEPGNGTLQIVNLDVLDQ